MVDHVERYEDNLKPAIEDLDHDPFYARDLGDLIDYAPQAISRTLKTVSGRKDYDIELIDRFPYLFTVEGNSAEDYPEEKMNQDSEESSSENIGEQLEDVYDNLQNEGELSEIEVRRALSAQTDDSLGLAAKTEKQGKLFDELKSYRDTRYISEENKFVVGE